MYMPLYIGVNCGPGVSDYEAACLWHSKVDFEWRFQHTNDDVQCIIHWQFIFLDTKRICNTAFVNIDVSRQISKYCQIQFFAFVA